MSIYRLNESSNFYEKGKNIDNFDLQSIDKNSNIILSGLDGSGKSTLALSLENILGLEKQHFSETSKEQSLSEKYTDFFLDPSTYGKVLDRSLLCEYAYGNAVRGYSRLTKTEILDILNIGKNRNFYIIYLFVELNKLLSRIELRNDDNKNLDLEKIEKYGQNIHKYYMEVLDFCSKYHNIFLLDTSTLSPLEINNLLGIA